MPSGFAEENPIPAAQRGPNSQIPEGHSPPSPCAPVRRVEGPSWGDPNPQSQGFPHIFMVFPIVFLLDSRNSCCTLSQQLPWEHCQAEPAGDLCTSQSLLQLPDSPGQQIPNNPFPKAVQNRQGHSGAAGNPFSSPSTGGCGNPFPVLSCEIVNLLGLALRGSGLLLSP